MSKHHSLNGYESKGHVGSIQILNIQKFIALGQKGFTTKFGNAQIVNITVLQLRIGLFMMTCFVHR